MSSLGANCGTLFKQFTSVQLRRVTRERLRGEDRGCIVGVVSVESGEGPLNPSPAPPTQYGGLGALLQNIFEI